MPAAGETIIAGRIPGERIATTIETANSANITTTETVVMSVTAPLVSGRTYRITAVMGVSSNVAADTVEAILREDNLTGTQLQTRRLYTPDVTGVARWLGYVEAEFTAVSTGDKTFVVTLDRITGSGTILLRAAADAPSYFYVDYIRG